MAGTLAVANGGTGVTASSGASSVVLRDTNANVTFNNWNPGLATTATAGGTTTLTAASAFFQRFTGSTTQTLKLPDATTLSAGIAYVGDNDSTGNVTVVDNGNNTLSTIVPGMAGYLYLENNGTTNGSWSGYMYVPGAGPTGAVTWGTAGLVMGGGALSGVSTVNMSGQLTNTVATGTAPFVVSSTTPVANLSIGGNAATATSATSATTATTATNALNLQVTDSTTSSSTFYLTMSPGTAASTNYAIGTSSTKLSFVPNTGTLSATVFSGSGASLTSLNGSNISSGTVAAARLGSGTPSSSNYLRGDGTWSTVSASPAGSNTQVQYNSSGSFAGSANLTFDGTNLTCGGSFIASSDERLKTDWEDLPVDFIENLAKVKHGNFTRIENGNKEVGVSAQSLQTVLDKAVVSNDEGMLSVNYGGAALVAAIELAKQITELKQEIAQLKGIK